MPREGVKKLEHGGILSVDEIEEIAMAAASLGIRKIRITGGEPLVRRGVEEIVRRVAAAPGVDEVVLTTNGILLPDKIDALVAAGIKRINISLDTLDEGVYREITRGGDVSAARRGVEIARAAGLTPLKINAVLMGGVNDDRIVPLVELTKSADVHLRFIELMPIGQCKGWNRERFVSNDVVTQKIPALHFVGTQGVARIYRQDGYAGTVGLINPLSNHFCGDCNRIRVTADGRLKPCLHSSDEIVLKGLSGEALREAMRAAIYGKPMRHRLEAGAGSDSARDMYAIGG
jgi:cyclic pyranopterin phosphate synthase